MLAEQSYSGHKSVHDAESAAKLGLAERRDATLKAMDIWN